MDQAVQIRNELLQTSGSYRSHPERIMHVATEPVYITESEYEVAAKRGQLIFDLEDRLNQIYVDETYKNPTGRIVRLIEGAIDDQTRRAQRLIARERPLSLLKRTDESCPGFIVEVQKRCGGMGLETVWHRMFYKFFPLANDEVHTTEFAGHVKSISLMMQKQTKSNIIILITPLKDFPGQCHFANLICAETPFIAIPLAKEIASQCIDGTTLNVTDELIRYLTQHEYVFPPEIRKTSTIEIGMFYRRELSLEDFVHFKGWARLLDAYLSGQLIIQPELNLMEDMKLPFGLLSDNAVREKLPASHLNLFATSAIMPASWTESFQFGNRNMTLEDVLNESISRRAYIIKYAGNNMEYGFGGRAVYRLSGLSGGQAKRKIEYALNQIRQGHHWLIQEQDKTHHRITYLDKIEDKLHHSNQMYVRYCFFYYRFDEGVKLILTDTAVRGYWKATRADDAIVAPLRLKKNATASYEPVSNKCMLRTVNTN